jgi:formate dehydrogenase subunit delta
MSHDTSPKKLIYMANQIGKFFAPQVHETAVAGIANHLTKFWDPSMRKKIVRHLSEGGEGSTRLSGKPCKHSGPNSLTKPDFSVSRHPRCEGGQTKVRWASRSGVPQVCGPCPKKNEHGI